ncbi:MAG: NAD(P)-dependent glycerol-3-phosphate dehydrogenase [Oscillospiraceae bacterium]|nr:NAD(P)-dependent glycerol-3-phosphate dehydrogenase [Oscillospiraceae bacterium]
MKKIGVLGAGTWGMALSRMLCLSGHSVTVWSALEKEIDEFSVTRRHPNLPGMEIPEQVAFTKEIRLACEGMDIVLFAVPSPFVRSTAKLAAPYITDGQIVVDVAKGMEKDTLFTMTQIIGDELKNPAVKLVALSGPTHAEEVAKDLPTTIVSACEDMAAAKLVQEVFTSACMRVYTNTDVLGVELCGAMKNIMALGSGIALGLGFGDNIKAALITRGMAEIVRLGRAMGCDERTFYGLAGVGDLIVTATSVHSRNNRCGMLLGQGVKPEDAIKQVGMVVEGIHALSAAMRLMEHYRVDMPIVRAVNNVVNCGADPYEEVMALMHRDQKPEI